MSDEVEVRVLEDGDVLGPADKFAGVAKVGSGWVWLWPDRAGNDVERNPIPGSQGWPPEDAVARARQLIEANNKCFT